MVVIQQIPLESTTYIKQEKAANEVKKDEDAADVSEPNHSSSETPPFHNASIGNGDVNCSYPSSSNGLNINNQNTAEKELTSNILGDDPMNGFQVNLLQLPLLNSSLSNEEMRRLRATDVMTLENLLNVVTCRDNYSIGNKSSPFSRQQIVGTSTNNGTVYNELKCEDIQNSQETRAAIEMISDQRTLRGEDSSMLGELTEVPSSSSSSVYSSVSPVDIDRNQNTLSKTKVFSTSSSSTFSSVDSSGGFDRRHRCEICGKGFPYLSILESHKRCHTGEKPFSCHYCDKSFAQKATLQVHERTHTGERPYKCKYCEKTFAQYGTKTVHEKSAHLGIRNYKCPKCTKCLSSPSALYTHKKTHGEKIFQCNFCAKTFTLKNYLKLHIKQVHEQNERKHMCKFCAKSFAYAGSLQVHLRTHTGERPYVCKYCPKAFASQGNLQSHERTHTGERPYSCAKCGRAFIQKSQLTAHEATHSYGGNNHHHSHSVCDNNSSTTTSIVSCSLSSPSSSSSPPDVTNASMGKKHRVSLANCYTINSCDTINLAPRDIADNNRSEIGNPPRILTNKNNTNSNLNGELDLVESIANNSSEINFKPQKNNNNNSEFECGYCKKRYAYASSLYVHTRLHTGERPFKCNYCEKTFTNQGNMQVHLRVHTGEKPYKCEGCGKGYAQKVGLKIHQEQCQAWLHRSETFGIPDMVKASIVDEGLVQTEAKDMLTGNFHQLLAAPNENATTSGEHFVSKQHTIDGGPNGCYINAINGKMNGNNPNIQIKEETHNSSSLFNFLLNGAGGMSLPPSSASSSVNLNPSESVLESKRNSLSFSDSFDQSSPLTQRRNLLIPKLETSEQLLHLSGATFNEISTDRPCLTNPQPRPISTSEIVSNLQKLAAQQRWSNNQPLVHTLSNSSSSQYGEENVDTKPILLQLIANIQRQQQEQQQVQHLKALEALLELSHANNQQVPQTSSHIDQTAIALQLLQQFELNKHSMQNEEMEQPQPIYHQQILANQLRHSSNQCAQIGFSGQGLETRRDNLQMQKQTAEPISTLGNMNQPQDQQLVLMALASARLSEITQQQIPPVHGQLMQPPLSSAFSSNSFEQSHHKKTDIHQQLVHPQPLSIGELKALLKF